MLIDRKSASTIRARRAELRTQLDLVHSFAQIEESCVPSYCHPNVLAAAVAWWRLLVACSLYRRYGRAGPILDFGAATGELFYLLDSGEAYHYVEENDLLVDALARSIPSARRERLAALPTAHFAAVFALDALEHNREVGSIADTLAAALRPGGRLFVSGPTENALYRVGRRLAGFDGHYHEATIYQIEKTLAERLHRVALRRVPAAPALFRLSVWEAR